MPSFTGSKCVVFIVFTVVLKVFTEPITYEKKVETQPPLRTNKKSKSASLKDE